MSELLPNAYAIAAALVQKHDSDRHVAILFAPAERRRHLHALQAFSLEIAGIRAAAKEPGPGEIRLQWWREVLDGTRAEEGAGHPVGLAIRDTIERCRLPLQPLQDLIDARSFDLYDDPPADWTALEGYCGETSSALVSLSSIILTGGEAAADADAAGHAGVAYSLTGLLRAFPWHARRGQVFLPQALLTAVGVDREDIVSGTDSPGLRAVLAEMRARARDHLAKARALKGRLGPEVQPAFLPLAMVERYLAPMEKSAYQPYRTIIDAANWVRIWAMWRGW
jgi:phytoene synthase